MKKRDVLNLIKYHMDGNDNAFINLAKEIASDFNKNGEEELSEYIMSTISDVNSLVPQIYDEDKVFWEKLDARKLDSLVLPTEIFNEIEGIINAINKKIGVNKFLFEGKPGTGKTQAVLQVARILNKNIYSLKVANIIDSKLGQTQKNLTSAFNELKLARDKNNFLILLDELDSIVLDRTNQNDLREMGRLTSTFLKMMDELDENIVLIATTNLYKYLDRAISRRFDFVVNFDKYTKEDLIDIAKGYLDLFLRNGDYVRDMKLIEKILLKTNVDISPAELKNIIKSAIAFSSEKNDYLKTIYLKLYPNPSLDLEYLKENGFTLREIENLTGTSKSKVSRLLNGGMHE